jgi:Creatinase/Prolidase N-terminal domain
MPPIELLPAVGPFTRGVLPKRFCNLDRLLFALSERGLDGIVATLPYNVFYLTGFNGVAHKADEPRPYAVILSRHLPEQPVLIVADYYLATFLKQPTWVEDIRPFRAVMMPLDLPAQHSDIDRFIPQDGRGRRGSPMRARPMPSPHLPTAPTSSAPWRRSPTRFPWTAPWAN